MYQHEFVLRLHDEMKSPFSIAAHIGAAALKTSACTMHTTIDNRRGWFSPEQQSLLAGRLIPSHLDFEWLGSKTNHLDIQLSMHCRTNHSLVMI